MVELLHIVTSLVSIALSSVLNSEMDTILEYRKNPFTAKRRVWFPNWKWWWEYRIADNFLIKVLFSFLRDGWHLVKSLRVYFFLLPVAILISLHLGINWYYSFLINIPLYLFQGIFFELSYEN
jgi:hypothetical protein